MTENIHTIKLRLDDSAVIAGVQRLGSSLGNISQQAVSDLAKLGGVTSVDVARSVGLSGGSPREAGLAIGKLQSDFGRLIASQRSGYDPTAKIPKDIAASVKGFFDSLRKEVQTLLVEKYGAVNFKSAGRDILDASRTGFTQREDARIQAAKEERKQAEDKAAAEAKQTADAAAKEATSAKEAASAEAENASAKKKKAIKTKTDAGSGGGGKEPPKAAGAGVPPDEPPPIPRRPSSILTGGDTESLSKAVERKRQRLLNEIVDYETQLAAGRLKEATESGKTADAAEESAKLQARLADVAKKSLYELQTYYNQISKDLASQQKLANAEISVDTLNRVRGGRLAGDVRYATGYAADRTTSAILKEDTDRMVAKSKEMVGEIGSSVASAKDLKDVIDTEANKIRVRGKDEPMFEGVEGTRLQNATSSAFYKKEFSDETKQRLTLLATARARLLEQGLTREQASLRIDELLKIQKTEQLRVEVSKLALTKAESDAIKKSADAETKKADIVARANDSRRNRDIGRIGELEQKLRIEPSKRFTTQDFNGLTNDVIRQIREQLVERVRAETELARQARREATEIGPERTRLLNQIKARLEEIGKLTEADVQALKAKPTSELAALSRTLGPTRSQQRKSREDALRAADDAAAKQAREAARSDALKAEVGPGRAKLIRQISERLEEVGKFTLQDLDLLRKKTKQELEALSKTLGPTRAQQARNRQDAIKASAKAAAPPDDPDLREELRRRGSTSRGILRIEDQINALRQKRGEPQIPTSSITNLMKKTNVDLLGIKEATAARLKHEQELSGLSQDQIRAARRQNALVNRILAIQEEDLARGKLTPFQRFDVNSLQQKSNEELINIRDLLRPPPAPRTPRPPAPTGPVQGPPNLEAEVLDRLFKERTSAARELLYLERKTANDYIQQAQIAALRKKGQLQLQAAEFRLMRTDEEFLKARAERLIEERKYNQAQRKANAEVARQQGFGGGGLIARFLGRFSGGENGPLGPTGGVPPTLGEFFGRGAAQITRYALPSALGYGAINGIKNTIKEAEELDRIFSTIEAQFDATFGPDAEEKFSTFRGEILKIARETGVAGQEVATVGFQIQGAFSGKTIDGVSNQKLVNNQIRASAEISKVTGLSNKEITDSLTAASLAFDKSFRKIGDVTINLQDRFGVLSKEIIPFLGDIAPVAKEAGFSLEEFATIAAITQQRSGRSGSALAEAYGRVIPAIANARTQLVDLAATNNNLSFDYIDKVASGSLKEVFFAVANNFDKMSKSSKEFVINLLGGRREAAAILPVFSDSAKLQEEINKTADAGDTLSERFDKISATLTETLARLQEQLRQLGVALYEGGLGDALKQIVEFISLLAAGLTQLFGLFEKLNGATDGWAIKIGALVVALKLLGATSANSRLNMPIGRAGRANRLAGNLAQVDYLGGFDVAPGYAAGAAAEKAATGGIRGALKAGGKLGPETNAGSFARFAMLTVALEVATSFASWVKDVRSNVEAARQQFSQLTEDKLKEELGKQKDPFSGGFFSDFKANLRRGIVGQDFDFRNIIEQELKGRKFDATGEQPTVAGASKLSPIGSTKSRVTAAQREDVLASIGKDIRNINGLRTEKDLEKLRAVAEGGDQQANILVKLAEGTKDEKEAALLALNDLARTDADAFTRLYLIINASPAYRAAIGQLDKEAAAAGALAASKDEANKVALDVQAAESAYESGQISLSAFMTTLRNKLEVQLKALEAAKAKGEDTSAIAKSVFDTEKKLSAFASGSIVKYSDIAQEFFEIQNGQGDVADKQNINRLVGLLESGALNQEDRLAKAKEVIKLLQSLDKTSTIPEKVRAVLAELIIDPKNNEELGKALDLVTKALGDSGDKVVTQIKEALIAVAAGSANVDSVRKILQEKILILSSVAGDLGFLGVGSELDKLIEAQKLLDDVAKLVANKVPTVATSNKKGKSAEDTAKDIAEARADYFKALIEGDPVKLAMFELDEAERQIAEAGDDEAARWRGMAAKVRAQRRLEAAQFDVSSAWSDLWVAYFEYYGDAVKAAQEQYDEAVRQRKRVDELFATGGAGDADKINAERDMLKAKANLRDAQLQDQLDQYQFLYDMGKITKAQFIQYLETLKQIPDLTQAQIRDLDRQIKQLQGELARDLQFNLPSQFRLPTLYEVRRIGQSGSSQAGYVDNRNVNITLNVTNGTTQQQMVDILTDVVGSAPRISSGTRRY